MGNLKAIREARMAEASRYTIAAMAEVLGVSVPTYRDREEHPEKLTRGEADKLARHLGVAVDDLF